MRSALAGYQMCVEQVMLQSLVVLLLQRLVGLDCAVLNSPPPNQALSKGPGPSQNQPVTAPARPGSWDFTVRGFNILHSQW